MRTTRRSSRCSARGGRARDRRGAPLPDRERPDGRPHLAARHGRPHLGVVDRRPHGAGPHPPRPAGHPPDPLDAEPSDPRPGDEGDSAAVQGRPAEAERGAHEVLPGEQDQPVRVVPADRVPDPDLHRALLRPARLRGRDLPAVPGVLPPVARSHRHHRAHEGRLGAGAPRRLRDQPAHLDLADVDADAVDRAARDDHGAPDRLHPVHPQLPHGPHDLLADDEPLDDRAGPRHPPPDAETRCATEEVEPDAAEGGVRRRGRRGVRGGSRVDGQRRARRTPRRAASRRRRRAGGPGGERDRARRGDRGDGGRGEVGRGQAARAARTEPRPRERRVPGGHRGRARSSRCRVHAGARHRERRCVCGARGRDHRDRAGPRVRRPHRESDRRQRHDDGRRA